MSKKAKICFVGAFIALVSTFVIQFMLGMWMNLNMILMVVAGGLVGLAVLFDWKLYWEFLTMRTTKHGMNMGAVIVMVVTLMVCLNYLANKHNKTWDLTQEKLNSLSEQSTKVLDGLKDDVEIKVFFKGPSAQEQKQRAKQSLEMYDDYGKVNLRFINAYVDQAAALQYLKDLPDRDQAPIFVFIEYGGKKVRVDEPFDEAAITSGLIKATRSGDAKVYFIQGHGERDLRASDDSGLQDFAKALGEASFKAEPLSLLDKPEVPVDATIVAIIGPVRAYLDAELEALRRYVQDGGRLFIALDPGQTHNLANLTKSLGVQFENNFILSLNQLVGSGAATILGRTFEPSNDVTSSFPQGSSFAIFPLASEVTAAAGKAPDLEVQEIVKSDGLSFTVNDISQPLSDKPATKPVSVAVTVKKTDLKDAEGKDSAGKRGFEAVVFGDSDFMSNRALMAGVNRDLALNAIAFLADQKDLISIKPKMPKGSMLTLTRTARFGVVIAGLALPVLLLVVAGIMWFRRRGA